MANRIVQITAQREDTALCGEAEEILLDWLRGHIMLEISFDVETKAWNHTATLKVDV